MTTTTRPLLPTLQKLEVKTALNTSPKEQRSPLNWTPNETATCTESQVLAPAPMTAVTLNKKLQTTWQTTLEAEAQPALNACNAFP
ncbi:conserved hypothetical protein [Coraliomargarita akajimensis DSM 45221]|uniref:Uncharacterized protein n=1 Tax=Coraliomargarita akajimensis (strain DSM 45221 / IAM 15411 / JCM 23193 / KCTC 12865 / 04OKA010-24) TaxID=583355 RepID=D5EHL9_CORAD|nr:conserved hypothetical protein [Coraliomargarita akajimensis DSM 45221]